MTRRTHESADDESTGLLHDRVHRELAATRAARSRRVYSVGDTTTTGRRVIEVRRSQWSLTAPPPRPADGSSPPLRGYYLLACPAHGERAHQLVAMVAPDLGHVARDAADEMVAVARRLGRETASRGESRVYPPSWST